jgi:cysteine-rich repeat protein
VDRGRHQQARPSASSYPRFDNIDTAAVDAISITVTYSLCSDNVIGLSEDCDDSNTNNGDCCSSTCQFETVGSPCPDGDLATATRPVTAPARA